MQNPWFTPFLFALFAFLIGHGASSAVAEAQDCGLREPCFLDSGRSYYARLPDHWDGKSSLPVLLHFHGWGRQGKLIVNHRRIAGATRSRGVLLLAPNGENRSWDFWTSDTDDVEFALRVLRDAAKKWPIDKSRIYVSGYSYGSAMAWRFACAEGHRLKGLLAVSGTIPDQQESCQSALEVRHVHGTSDNVMDYPFGPDGDVKGAVELWRHHNGCSVEPQKLDVWKAVRILPFTRHIWTNCISGKKVILDVHSRGHFIPRKWIAHQLDELL